MLLLEDAAPSGLPSPWKLKVKTGSPVYSLVREQGLLSACLTSRSSSFSIQRTANIDPAQFSILSWKWLASQLPPEGDLRQGRTDDQAAQLFVAFDGGKAISYVWDSNAPIGTITRDWVPFVVEIRVLVVESGSNRLNTWQTYEQNVREDYRRLFGGTPPSIQGIRFQINSQHTKSIARSCIASISFSKR